MNVSRFGTAGYTAPRRELDFWKNGTPKSQIPEGVWGGDREKIIEAHLVRKFTRETSLVKHGA